MNVRVRGIDLAKTVFQLHGIDQTGQVVLRKTLTRTKLLAFVAQLEPCLIGLEACGGAHYWARELGKLGHKVKLISPQFVKPFVKSNKNDSADAEAICIAVSQPHMRFVPLNSVEQQDSKRSGNRTLARIGTKVILVSDDEDGSHDDDDKTRTDAERTPVVLARAA